MGWSRGWPGKSKKLPKTYAGIYLLSPTARVSDGRLDRFSQPSRDGLDGRRQRSGALPVVRRRRMKPRNGVNQEVAAAPISNQSACRSTVRRHMRHWRVRTAERPVVAVHAVRRHDMGLDRVVQRAPRHGTGAHLVGQGRQCAPAPASQSPPAASRAALASPSPCPRTPTATRNGRAPDAWRTGTPPGRPTRSSLPGRPGVPGTRTDARNKDPP